MVEPLFVRFMNLIALKMKKALCMQMIHFYYKCIVSSRYCFLLSLKFVHAVHSWFNELHTESWINSCLNAQCTQIVKWIYEFHWTTPTINQTLKNWKWFDRMIAFQMLSQSELLGMWFWWYIYEMSHYISSLVPYLFDFRLSIVHFYNQNERNR